VCDIEIISGAYSGPLDAALPPEDRATSSRAIIDTTAGAGVNPPLDPGDLAQQAETVFQHIGGILKAEGGSYEDLVTVSVFLTEGGREAYTTVNETRARIFGDARPASTMVVVRELARPELKIEVNAIALLKK